LAVLCNILVIDDDIEVINTLEAILGDYGMTVKGIQNEQDIYPTIMTFQPNVILLDVILGASDGRNISKGLKNHFRTRHIPVILFSSEGKFKDDLIECSAEDFLLKPVQIGTLISTIKRFCAAEPETGTVQPA
jgi:CheY-like chemotaxis protein